MDEHNSKNIPENIHKNIFAEVVKLSGLDKNTVTSELSNLIASKGKNLEDLTLPELRSIISEYARRTLLEVYKSHSQD